MMQKYLNKYRAIPVQVRAAFWFLICTFLQKAITVITTPIFTRLLTTEEYGRFNVFNSWYGILSVFVTLSLGSGVFSQAIIKFEEDRNRYISSIQGLSLILTAFWTVVYLLFMDSWNRLFSLTTVQMLALLTMCWSSSAWAFWAAEQRTLNKYRILVVLTLLVAFIKPVLGVILVVSADDKVTARILGIAGVEFLASVYCFVTQMRRGKVVVHWEYWKYAVVLCIPLIPHYLSQTVLNNSDRIMIERMVDADKAGIYSLAYSISTLMTMFNTALGQTISPWMFRKIKDKSFHEIAPIAYGTLIFIAAVNILLIFLAPEVVRIFAPPEYYEAIWIIPPVAMSAYYLFMYDFFARFEFYYEKTVGIMFASIFGAVLNLVLNFICIRIWGYVAAAYTTLICYLVYTVCHYIMMSRICRNNNIKSVYDLKILTGISVAFMAFGFIILATYNNMAVRFAALAVTLLAALLNYKRIRRGIQSFMKLRKEDA